MKKLGWVLSNNEQGDMVIQKDDDSKRFRNDDDATVFVAESYTELLETCKMALRTLNIYEISEYSRTTLKQVIAKVEGE